LNAVALREELCYSLTIGYLEAKLGFQRALCLLQENN
jgi:hypothetical protein